MTRTFARELRLVGEAERRADAEPLLIMPGDAALIRRGVLRSVLLRCPDGCGETLLVNLDPRAGKAWRLRVDRGGLTLYPSVWRDGGCGSHFIVWQHRILWCGGREAADNEEPEYLDVLEERMERVLRRELSSSEDIGDRLHETPWEIARVGRRLVEQGRAREGGQGRESWFGLPEA